MLSDSEILEQADAWFKYAVDHPTWVEAKKLHLKCFQYREGEQWTEAEKRELAARGQPDTVNNRVAVTINKLMGDFVDRKYRIGARPRNQKPDEQVAKDLDSIFHYVRQSNKLEYEETDMADDGFTCGFGVLEVSVEFDDLNQPEIKVRHEDSLVVWPDPNWRKYDWNEDARFIFRARWFDADEVKQKYPKAKARVDELSSGWNTDSGGTVSSAVDTFRNDFYIDEKKKMIRVIDCEYKAYEREVICVFDDPQGKLPYFSIAKSDPNYEVAHKTAKELGIEYEEITRVRKVINRVVFIGGLVLEHKKLRQKFFSLIPYVMYRKKNGAPYSLIALGLSQQDAINKRESKALHLLNTNQTVAERGAYNDKEKFQEEIHKPDGFIEVNDGALQQNRIVFRNNIELATAQFSLHRDAQNSFAEVVGVNPGAPIDTGELRGSAALNRKFTEMGKPVARIFENLKRTRSILGAVLLNFIQIYTTPEKAMLITDDQNAVQLVELSRDRVQRIKMAQYDAVIDDYIDSPTLQQEQWALFLQYLPQIIQFGPYWLKKFIQMSDLRDKNQIVAELDQQNGPPPVQPRLSLQANINELTPEERAAVWAAAGQMEAAQSVAQGRPQTTTQEKLTVDVAKAKIQAVSASKKKEDKDDDTDPI